jgi:hypothetical protein
MPIVARLSKRFYEELGEDIANELVELLNSVDAASRQELRELNELNFARFDAKLEQRVAELRQSIGALDSRTMTALAEQRVDVERALKEQARWFITTWAVQLAAIGGLYALVLATR